MRHLRLFLAVIAAALTLSLAAAPSFAVDVNAGPIWNNDDAQGKCATACGGRQNWDGNWRTTEFGRMSVCSCRVAANNNFAGQISSASTCSIAAAGACRACSAMCADGRQAQCAGGQTNVNICVVPASCACR
jgi:hypothetical protein